MTTKKEEWEIEAECVCVCARTMMMMMTRRRKVVMCMDESPSAGTSSPAAPTHLEVVPQGGGAPVTIQGRPYTSKPDQIIQQTT